MFQPCTRMSGWWLAASASSATRSTNAIAAAKSAKLELALDRVCALAQLPAARGRPGAAAMLARRSAAPSRTRGYPLAPQSARAYSQWHAHRQPRPPRHRAAVRARPRRRGRRRDARVRPPAARRCELERVTRDVLPAGPRAPARSTRRCASARSTGEAIYELDREALAALEPGPDRHPGAVPGVRGLLRRGRRARRASCPPSRSVIALDPKTLGETLGDVRTLAAGDRPRASGRRAGRRSRRRASTACRLAVRGRRASARRGARVARPGLRRRALDARS